MGMDDQLSQSLSLDGAGVGLIRAVDGGAFDLVGRHFVSYPQGSILRDK